MGYNSKLVVGDAVGYTDGVALGLADGAAVGLFDVGDVLGDTVMSDSLGPSVFCDDGVFVVGELLALARASRNSWTAIRTIFQYFKELRLHG